MVSDFRKKKLMRGFQFVDTDKNGTITRADFDLAIEKIAKARGWAPGDANLKETQQLMTSIWEGLQAKSGSTNGEVSADQWLTLWDEYGKNPTANPTDVQNLFKKFMFSLQDAGKDGKIDSEEFIAVVTSFGRVEQDEATTAWGKISKGNTFVSWDEYQNLWNEFFGSEDPNSAGNYLFGRGNL